MFERFAFWKNYGEGKLAQAGDALLAGMVKLDPAGMSEAEIRAEREKFEKFSVEVEEYRSTYNKEAKEAEAARQAYNRKMDQIRALETAAEANPEKALKFQTAADKLRGEAAALLDDAKREIEEAELAKQDLDEVEAIQREMATTIKSLESNLSKAKAELERAKRAEERANLRAAHQERLVGIRKGANSGGIASQAMAQAADEATKRANAAKRRTELLTDAKDNPDPTFQDNDVAAILSGVADEAPTPTRDLPDRL
ncbi:hypothetical protein [Endothiovibrio diazotrophicus]